MNIHKTFKRGELENLPSDQLDRMLHEELGKDTKNAALIMEMMQILEEREAETPKPNVGGAWQIFVERYNTQITPEPVMRRKSPLRWMGVVAAVVAVFFLVSFGIPKAAGYNNIVQLIASWTEDFFYLSRPDDTPPQNEYVFETDNPGLQQVYDAVVELGITDPVVPMWIPDGYELVEIKKTIIENGDKLFIAFENGSSRITIYYKATCNPRESNYPKDITDVEIVEFNGAVVSVLFNDGHTTSIWQTNGIECLITTTEDSATTIRSIKSIFYGELL